MNQVLKTRNKISEVNIEADIVVKYNNGDTLVFKTPDSFKNKMKK